MARKSKVAEAVEIGAGVDAGPDKKSIAYTINTLKKKFGDNVIFKMGEKSFGIRKIPFGIKQLDGITIGGIPRGRLTQIAGPPKAGKTTLAYALIAQVQKDNPDNPICLFIDVEKTYDEDRAVLCGCNLEHIYVCQPDTAEEAFEVIHAFVPTGINLIVLDSVPYLYPQKDTEADIGAVHMAPIPRFLTVELPILIPKINRYGTALVFINQIRDNVGMLGWGEMTHLPGGRQLQHTSSMILKIAKKESIKKSDDVLGQVVKVRIDSSKVCPPLKDCALNLIFERGYVEDEDLERVKTEVRREHLGKGKVSAVEDGEEEDSGNDGE